jgi:hypothetical protein
VTSSDLQLWAIHGFTPLAPVTMNPGHSATIRVTITPSGAAGSTVHGRCIWTAS